MPTFPSTSRPYCRRTLLGATALALTLAASAADWPQHQQNAARTGHTDDTVTPPFRTRWFWAGPTQTLLSTTAGGTADLLSREGHSYPLPAKTAFTIASTAQPITASGRLFIGTVEGTAHGINATNGATLWSTPIPGGTSATAAASAADDLVVFAGQAGQVYGLQASSGLVRWVRETRRSLSAAPCIVGNTVYVADHGGWVYALALSDGALRWQSGRLGGPVIGGLAADATRLYLTAENLVVYTLRQSDGGIDAQRPVRGQSARFTWPVVAGGFVFAQTCTAPYIGSEDMNDPLLAGVTSLADEEAKTLGFLTGDTSVSPIASADWQRTFPIRLTDFTQPFVVCALPADGCGYPAPPVAVDHLGRVLTYFPTRFNTLTPKCGFGTAYTIDVAAIDLTNGKRIRIDPVPNSVAPWDGTWEADNLYAMSSGGPYLWLRQNWRGTHVIDLRNEQNFGVQAAVRHRDGGNFVWDVVYRDTPPETESGQTPMYGRVAAVISGTTVFLSEPYGIVALEHKP